METKKPENTLLQKAENYFSLLDQNTKIYQNALLDALGLNPDNRRKFLKILKDLEIIHAIKTKFWRTKKPIILDKSEALIKIHTLIQEGLIGEIVGKEFLDDLHSWWTEFSEVDTIIDTLLQNQCTRLQELLQDPRLTDKEHIKEVMKSITLQKKSPERQAKIFKTIEKFFDQEYKTNFLHTSTFVYPTDLDYRGKSQEPSQSLKTTKGPFDVVLTLNPETQDLDFEHMQVKIFDLRKIKYQQDFDMRLAIKWYSECLEVWQVCEYVTKKYSDEYYIPGLEYWKWLLDNPQKKPKEFTPVGLYLLPGSAYKINNTLWHIPSFHLSNDMTGSKDPWAWLTREFYYWECIVLLKRP